MKYITLQKALDTDMPKIASSLCGAKGNRMKCPFHSDNELSMRIYEDHVTCPKCGIFNPVDFTARVLDVSRPEAVRHIDMLTGDGSLISQARKAMRALFRNEHADDDKFRTNLPEEYTGCYIRDIIRRINIFQGTELVTGNLKDGTVYFLDHGFEDEEGNIIGSPEFTKIRGEGDYITICPNIRKAIMMSADSAYRVTPDILAEYDRPVLARNREEAEQYADAGLKAGYQEKGKIVWISNIPADEGAFQYHDRGDLYDYLRSMPGLDRWETDMTDAWLFMTGNNLTLPLESLLSGYGKLAIDAVRIPNPLKIVNTCKGIRKNIVRRERMVAIAPEKTSRPLNIKPPHEKNDVPALQYTKSGVTYRRIPARDMWFTGDAARIHAVGGYIETSADNVYRISRRNSAFYYIPISAELIRKYRTDRGTVTGRFKEDDLTSFREIKYKDSTVPVKVFKRFIKALEKGRTDISLGPNAHIYVPGKYLVEFSPHARYVEVEFHNGHSYIVLDENDTPIRNDGRIEKINAEEMRQRMIDLNAHSRTL